MRTPWHNVQPELETQLLIHPGNLQTTGDLIFYVLAPNEYINLKNSF